MVKLDPKKMVHSYYMIHIILKISELDEFGGSIGTSRFHPYPNRGSSAALCAACVSSIAACIMFYINYSI